MSRIIKATYVRVDADPIHIEAPEPFLLYRAETEVVEEAESEAEISERLRLRIERVQQLERDLEEQRLRLQTENDERIRISMEELKEQQQKQQIDLITEREAILQQAQEDGFRAGLKKGYEEGLASVQDQLDQARQALQEAYLEAERRVQDSERVILELVFALAVKILQTELTSNEALILQQIRLALSQFKQSPQVLIKVPQERYGLVQNQLSKLKEEFRQILALDCLVDPTLPQTDIVVDSPFGMVDVRFDAQLEVLREALLQLQNERQP